MVMALQCDATRSISFMLGNGGSSCAPSFPWLSISGDHHGLAHNQDANALPKIDNWHVSQLAYFCQKLDAIDEGGATMLDNSLVFMSSEIMNGISHDQDNKGILLLGTAGGQAKDRPAHRLPEGATGKPVRHHAERPWRAGHDVRHRRQGPAGRPAGLVRIFYTPAISALAAVGFCWHSSSARSSSGTTMVASDSMTNIGVSAVSLSQVIFSFGVAPE